MWAKLSRPIRILTQACATALLALALAVGVTTPAVADDEDDLQDFTFDRVDSVIELSRDAEGVGVATITETYIAVFPDEDQNRGLQRRIPTQYDWVPLHPEVLSVTDESGEPRPFETETDDDHLVVTSAVPEGEFVHGEQTYVITYEVENVARAMDNGVDEFYWDILGHDWAQPIGTFTGEIRIDRDLAPALTGDMRCYRGELGADDECDLAQSEDGVVTLEVADLAPHEGVTVAIGFEPGTFTPFDSSLLGSPWAIAQMGGAALGAVALVWAGSVRRRKLQDEPGRPVVIAEYEPPAGVDAATAAAILRKTSKIVPAEILEQAVGGSLMIIESTGAFGRAKFTAQLVDPSRADENGRIILQGLFGDDLRPGATFEFGSTSTRFGKAAQSLHTWAAARDKQLRRPSGLSRIGQGPMILFAVAFSIAVPGGIAALMGFVTPLVPILLLVFVFLGLFAVLLILGRSPLTRDGAEIRDHLQGLREFIAWAEEDRIRMLQSPGGAERRPVDTADPRQMLVLYERLLPFAVVFGQERQWAERLTAFYPNGVPDWYAGSGPLNAVAFSAGISSLSSTAVSSSVSSSSGGSSGGGFSGGGGGGGGGGGV
ncbi:DUF2207 domain-containing protein [Microbacterium phosphatis]|uniref:DUF2207 domain-containing protein n=1 Tax=Microbacterium phosphatis TaxID=3140248 RepID=UPI0031403868